MDGPKRVSLPITGIMKEQFMDFLQTLLDIFFAQLDNLTQQFMTDVLLLVEAFMNQLFGVLL